MITRRQFIKGTIILGASTLLPAKFIPTIGASTTFKAAEVAEGAAELAKLGAPWRVTHCIIEDIQEGIKIVARQMGASPNATVYSNGPKQLMSIEQQDREEQFVAHMNEYYPKTIEFNVSLEQGLLLEVGDKLKIEEYKG